MKGTKFLYSVACFALCFNALAADDTSAGNKTSAKEVEILEPPNKINENEIEEAPRAIIVPSDPVQIYGYKEWIYIGEEEYKLKAKLDTGAKTSSIHVDKTHLFERDGRKWVRFVVVDPDRKEKKGTLVSEAPLIRTARIKSSNGSIEERFVVELFIRIGDQNRIVEFSLSNREDLIHPVLLGRETIKTLGWVDSSRKYLSKDKIMR